MIFQKQKRIIIIKISNKLQFFESIFLTFLYIDLEYCFQNDTILTIHKYIFSFYYNSDYFIQSYFMSFYNKILYNNNI